MFKKNITSVVQKMMIACSDIIMRSSLLKNVRGHELKAVDDLECSLMRNAVW